MGAVTAIMYGDQDPSIAGMVLDSPFSSLKKLVEELVKEKVNLPNFVINQALKLVKSTVQKKANFKLDDIEPIKFAERCFIPALFVAANNDNFVKPHHSKMLHDIYPGDKNLVNIEGDHNSHRPRFFKDSATIFFYNTLQVQYIKEISDNYAGYYKKKNEIFEEDNINKNLNNNNSKNDLLNESKQIIGNVVRDNNLNNIDFEGDAEIEALDEEKVFKLILENSKKDFENLIDSNNNGFGYVGSEGEISDNNNKEINKDKPLFDFLNSQVKNNNRENKAEIKNLIEANNVNINNIPIDTNEINKEIDNNKNKISKTNLSKKESLDPSAYKNTKNSQINNNNKEDDINMLNINIDFNDKNNNNKINK